MNPLGAIQRVLTRLCGVPPAESDTKREKVQYIIFTVFVITIHSLSLISSATFIYRNVSVDLLETLYSLLHTVAAIQAIYQSIATILLRRKLFGIFESLQKIYNENESSDWFHLLKQTNENCEWFWPIYKKYFLFGFLVSTVINATVSVISSYVTYGHFEAEHAYHPLKYTLPWNQSTLPGYTLEIGFGIAATESYLISNGSLLMLFVSICLHHQTFYKMYRNEAMKLNDRDDEHRNDAEHLNKLIRFHISVKDWFLDSAEAFSTLILIVLITSMLHLACCIFQFDLQMKHPDIGLFIIWISILVGLSNLFAYCFCGKMATESYEKMADSVYDANWYELDPKLQKHIIVILANTQRPIYYHGFGVVHLNLETFLNFVRATYTYYMIFKTLTSD